MAAGLAVDRTDVLARPAPNALQSLPRFYIAQNFAACIVQQDYMKFLRPIAHVHACPDGVVWVHALTSRRARKRLEEYLEILEARNYLLDPCNTNKHFGQRQAHATVAFGFNDRNAPSLGHQEIGSADGEGRLEESPSQVVTRRRYKIFSAIAKLLQLHLTKKDVSDLLAILV